MKCVLALKSLNLIDKINEMLLLSNRSAKISMMRFFIRLAKFLHTHEQAIDKLDLRMVGNEFIDKISNKN